jgi:ankyrin repeat protein
MTTTIEFFDAVRSGDVAAVDEHLRGDSTLASARNESGVSALLWAYYNGQSGVAERLLTSGVALDIFDAAAAGDVDRLTQLLDGDPDLVGAYSEDGYTALHFAAFFDRGKALRLLLDRGADVGAVARNDMQVQPLHSGVAANSREIVAALLAAGADPNAKQQGGFTPLMAAEQNEKEGDMVRLLMDHGAEESASAPAE